MIVLQLERWTQPDPQENTNREYRSIEMVLNLREEKVRGSSTRTRDQDTACGGGGNRGRTRTTPTTARTKTASSSSIIKKITRKSRRKSRRKARKPKYLSLRLQLSRDDKARDRSNDVPAGDHPQLNLFPLHPESLVEDKDAHDENVAYWFSAADGGATTLTGLLGAAATPSSSGKDSKNRSTCTTTTSATLSPSSASLTYAYRGRQDGEEVALVRTAMRRNKERKPSEERWVRYSEVVERRDDQEVSSCCAAVPGAGADLGCWRNPGLSLKLNYQEILNAWSDKAPLYVHAAPDSPQTVPDIHDQDHFHPPQLSNGSSDGQGTYGGCVWRVPEVTMTDKTNEQGLTLVRVKAEEQQEQVEVVAAAKELKVGQREASVRRYKEKRQNRLFSKKIRYQVRKLNAEKRPRLKGRFVKRS